MGEVGSLFRFCPSCGRRFHIKLMSKKLVGERKEAAELKRPLQSVLGYGRYQTHPVFVEQDVPLTIDVKEFQYSYRCKHCGHAWSEMRVEES